MIFHDLLQEVGEVIDRQANLQASLDKTGTDIANRIALQVAILQQTMTEVGPELGRHVARSMKEQLDAAKQPISTAAEVAPAALSASEDSLAIANEALIRASQRIEAAVQKASQRPLALGIVAVASAAAGSIATAAAIWMIKG